MKAYIGYGIWAKPDMVNWLFSGITENFPSDTHVGVFIEAVDDDTDEAVQNGLWDHFEDCPNVRNLGTSKEHLLEHGVHAKLIEAFLKTDCHCLIIPHDDNRFQRPLIPDLQKLWDKYGTNLGWISGRDGYSDGYRDMVSSPFSQSTGAVKEALPIGEHREVKMMNTGPVVYFRHVIEKAGLPDPDMAWYWWDDYALRCGAAGLTNILLSMDCLHEKFGRLSNNQELYSDAVVADGMRRLREKWGNVL